MSDYLKDYDFDLPRSLIAQTPVPHRSDARMMVLDRRAKSIAHHYVRDLPELLTKGDAIVVNDSKVLPARLIGFRTSTGGRWEGLYLRSNEQGIAEFLSKSRGNIQVGESITVRDLEGREALRLKVVATPSGGTMFLQCSDAANWEEVLERCGRVPLPHYIRDGAMIDADRERYQTVYARSPGSVAAPTAGLHFTEKLIRELRDHEIAFMSVTLHVGLGTFRPIQADLLSDHRMHAERGSVSEAVAKKLSSIRESHGRLIAVGTTTTRILETAARDHDGRFEAWNGETDLFIQPGFRFQAIDGLLTNFHLPKSSLIVLVSAFAGREFILEAYRQAIAEKYRFYSYGDCMLIL